ncbi:flavin reductase family protein [Streptomyces cyaneochromogenes]|uniref:flavin reductase family protein n=1 Tax=Streptomyces cyaneochromogenes TaxID=2496836 RepID=UPI00158CFB65|nr:flavin reductase family protein [Streptomyces cyaneochromogenes]
MTASAADGRTALFRRTAGRFPTGVTVVTTVSDGEPYGMTANAFMTVSLDPLLVAVGIGLGARGHDRVLRSGRFAVTVLSDRQTGTARRFADPARPVGAAAFAADDWTAGPATGCPVLPDGVGWFDCSVRDAHPAGDHTLVIGRVEDFGPLTGERPLVFVDGSFTAPDTSFSPSGPPGARIGART